MHYFGDDHQNRFARIGVLLKGVLATNPMSDRFQDTLEEQNKMDMQSQELMEWKEKMEILLNEPDTFIQMQQEGRGKTK